MTHHPHGGTGPKPVIYALFLLSGCAGLIYEVVWTRELIFVFGGTTYAITTILVAFMSGLGFGSYVAGRLSHRLRQPGRTYGVLEIGIGLYALLVPLLFRAAEPAYRMLYPHLIETPGLLTAARFCIGFAVLLLPTTFMGATLPILVRHVTGLGHGFGRSVGLLYGINTLGAMIGTTAAGFWLLPALGLTSTTWVAAGLNLAVGLAAIVLLRFPATGPAPGAPAAPAPVVVAPPAAPHLSAHTRTAILVAFALSGFAAMVYQIAWTRALVLSLGSSTYSFTCILAAFILGLAAGSLCIARWVDRLRQPVAAFGLLEIAIGLSAVLIVPLHGRVPLIMARIVEGFREDYGTLLWLQFLLIIAITFVPTVLMGAVFPLVTRLIAIGKGDPGAATGQAYAVNTLGTILGSFLAGFVMIRSDVLGVQNSIVAAALINTVVGAWLVLAARPPGKPVRHRAALAAVAVVLVPGLATAAGTWDRSLLLSAPYLARGSPRGGRAHDRILYYAEGVDLTVAVGQAVDQPDSMWLSVNGKGDASTDLGDMTTQLIIGHLPALLVDDGKSACVIGMGSGTTLSAIARHPSYERIDCAEISHEVIRAAEFFSDYNYNIQKADPRVHTIRADGRNHLLLTNRTYDLIVSEPSNPWMSGVSNLFTREYFELCRRRLAPNGRLCAWLHSYSMSPDDFRMIIRTMFDVFEFVSIWERTTDYLLIAGHTPTPVPLDDMLRRFATPAVREDLYRIGMADLGRILGSFITSGKPLRDWVEGSPVHTDDNALLEFSAPRNLYRNSSHEIASALATLQRSPFDEVVAASDRDARHRAVRDRVSAAVTARGEIAEAWELGRRADFAGSLRLFISAYRRNPGDAETYRILRGRRPLLEMRAPALARSPAMQALFAEVDELRPPTLAPMTGAKLADIAQMLKASGVEALKQRRWSLAAEYLAEARECLEDDETVAMLALALIRADRAAEAVERLDAYLREQPTAGRSSYLRAQLAVRENDPDKALTMIETAMRSGAVTADQVRREPALQALSEDARFKMLVGGNADSRPATAPASP